MIMLMYAVYDSQAEAAMRPLFFERDAVAVRWFTGAVHDEANQMGRTPEDFTLYRLGDFDDESMLVEGVDPVRVINGLEARKGLAVDRQKVADLQRQIHAIENGEDRRVDGLVVAAGGELLGEDNAEA